MIFPCRKHHLRKFYKYHSWIFYFSVIFTPMHFLICFQLIYIRTTDTSRQESTLTIHNLYNTLLTKAKEYQFSKLTSSQEEEEYIQDVKKQYENINYILSKKNHIYDGEHPIIALKKFGCGEDDTCCFYWVSQDYNKFGRKMINMLFFNSSIVLKKMQRSFSKFNAHNTYHLLNFLAIFDNCPSKPTIKAKKIKLEIIERPEPDQKIITDYVEYTQNVYYDCAEQFYKSFFKDGDILPEFCNDIYGELDYDNVSDYELQLQMFIDYCIPEKELLFNIFPGFLNIHEIVVSQQIEVKALEKYEIFLLQLFMLDIWLQVIKHDFLVLFKISKGEISFRDYINQRPGLVNQMTLFCVKMFGPYITNYGGLERCIVDFQSRQGGYAIDDIKFYYSIITSRFCYKTVVEKYKQGLYMDLQSISAMIHKNEILLALLSFHTSFNAIANFVDEFEFFLLYLSALDYASHFGYFIFTNVIPIEALDAYRTIFETIMEMTAISYSLLPIEYERAIASS